ncbi:MAG: acyl carrier protein [Candidatus Omnitrophica bacterium]|nr:acyl carrier protein [Candidatus Omnitrophota bacterium]
MDKLEILEKTRRVFRDVFDKDQLIIDRMTSSKDIEGWDSLANINLIVAIEKEFKIKFILSELISLDNVGAMVDLIEKKIK